MSLFDSDIAMEANLGSFLSKQYSKASLKTYRISDKKIQLLGVDLILETDGGVNFKVDEKAQLHYLNKGLPTFALEIDYLKNGTIKNGWLFDSQKITEIYAFVFSIHLIEGIKKLTKEEDIESCEVVFVRRFRLINELSKRALDFKTCIDKSKELRAGAGKIKIDHDLGFNFQISHQLAEQPVNLIVKKTFLEGIGKKFQFKRS